MSQIDKQLFSGSHDALTSWGDCPECGAALQLKHSKKGAFCGCSAYPTCQFTKPLVDNEIHTLKILSGSHCSECGEELALKKGRFGIFVGCSNFPTCHHIEKIDKPDDTGVPCPSCSKGELFEKQNRYGKTFYSCDQYPKCKFVVNNRPVKGQCEKCGFALLLERKMAAGLKYQCADKKCGHYQAQ